MLPSHEIRAVIYGSAATSLRVVTISSYDVITINVELIIRPGGIYPGFAETYQFKQNDRHKDFEFIEVFVQSSDVQM